MAIQPLEQHAGVTRDGLFQAMAARLANRVQHDPPGR